MSHAGGRPTKYDDSVLEITREYINSCGREATELPTIEGLAAKLGVNGDTINEWANKESTDELGKSTGLVYEEFSVTIKELKDKQKNQLMNDGLYGGKEINTPMAIFLLKVNHNMVEKTGLDLTTGGKELKQLVVLDTKKE